GCAGSTTGNRSTTNATYNRTRYDMKVWKKFIRSFDRMYDNSFYTIRLTTAWKRSTAVYDDLWLLSPVANPFLQTPSLPALFSSQGIQGHHHEWSVQANSI